MLRLTFKNGAFCILQPFTNMCIVSHLHNTVIIHSIKYFTYSNAKCSTSTNFVSFKNVAISINLTTWATLTTSNNRNEYLVVNIIMNIIDNYIK